MCSESGIQGNRPSQEEERCAHSVSGHLPQAAEQLLTNRPSLADRYGWLETMINHVPDYIYAKDLQGRFLFANDAVVRDNGLSSLDELIGITDFDLHRADLAASIREIECSVIETGVPDLGFDERALKGGSDRWLMMSRVPLRDKDGRIVGVVGASRDITARKTSERLMSVQARLLEMIVASIPVQELLERLALLLEEGAGGVQTALFAACRESELELIACPSFPSLKGVCVPVAHMTEAAHEMEEVVSRICSRADFVRCLDIRASDGSLHGILGLALTGAAPDPAFAEFIASTARLAGIAIDRIRAEERIRFLAEHDALTCLPTRERLDRDLKSILSQAAQEDRQVAVAFLDVDNFKLVNDSLGHDAGDELLTEVASRISAAVGSGGMAARIGGDEFVVVLTETDFLNHVGELRRTLALPHCVGGHELRATASIGVALFPDHGRTASQLLAHADVAMYRAKLNGRDGTVIFSEEMADEASRKLRHLEDLRQALKHQEIVLHFQPQKNLQSGAVTGLEALVRWQHPEKGLIYPNSFIPLAEEAGLILELGRKVLEMACHQAKAWQDKGLPPVTMGVNMSARQFQEPGLTQMVSDVLTLTGLEPRWLEIEITESLIMKDVDAAVARMGELTALGVGLALDDFGTGYSSLSMLKRFPLSRLKIDRSFIAEIPHDEDDKVIVSAIISLAQKLGLEVIAEGVETEAQAAFLLNAGCQEVQGYLMGRPVPAHELIL